MEVVNSFIDVIMANIAEIRINYIIDIGIIAIVFYKLLGLIKETRAEQLVKGFIIILVISKLSGWAKLYAINYILQSTFTIGLIALVILFQPELRKALEHLGRSQWLISGNKKTTELEMTQSINEIVDAVGVMSRKKIGALIVIERTIGINDIVETGTVVDAQIGADLLMNIFYPKSPLHDGAVVIKNNRLMAAGCLLPLSSNKYISKELGTRHRAAMGMTESSDAMIIIVSEETGAISMAIEGKLQRFLDTGSLRELMKQHMDSEKERVDKSKANGIKDDKNRSEISLSDEVNGNDKTTQKKRKLLFAKKEGQSNSRNHFGFLRRNDFNSNINEMQFLSSEVDEWPDIIVGGHVVVSDNLETIQTLDNKTIQTLDNKAIQNSDNKAIQTLDNETIQNSENETIQNSNKMNLISKSSLNKVKMDGGDYNENK